MLKDPNKILLIQPRHIYAPNWEESQIGHVYLPTSLLSAAAIFIAMGLEVEFHDENIENVIINHNIVGINLVGSPYIPIAIEYEKRLRSIFGDNFILILGGQVISGLTENDFRNLFSDNVINGNIYSNLSVIFKVEESSIPKIEQLSLKASYELIKPHHLKMYLESEFGFYLSQGCKHSCTFCAAKRTKKIPEYDKAEEVYRNLNIALEDFEYLLSKANHFGIDNLRIYLSNLDLFQTPLNLLAFADGVFNIRKKYPNIDIELRGLATAMSFLSTHRKQSFIIDRMVQIGLKQVGFGIDGATYKVYKNTRKPQTVKDCYDVIKISKLNYNIIPEILMVFGHNDNEDEEALKLAVEFCEMMHTKYNAIPRPHVAKDLVPGNDGWLSPKNDLRKSYLINSPILFQNLDFTCLPSAITHPDDNFRNLVTDYYITICNLPASLTQYVMPLSENMNAIQFSKAGKFNLYRYDI